ncbi:MAG: hypothetical protein H0Z33_12180 [Bacillaceae bacterium]|nr:hypothetical protein [Bacillaceae bacterium]
MRQDLREAWAKQMNRQLMSVDFHDFLQKEALAESDVELSRETGLSLREIRHLRQKRLMKR